jgi:hypothetical protein
MLKGAPKPKVVTTTAGGITHRLRWADRNSGWRMRCSCGWLDPKVRWTESGAIAEGNRHAVAERHQDSAMAKELNNTGARLHRLSMLVKAQTRAGMTGRTDPVLVAKLQELDRRAQVLSTWLTADATPAAQAAQWVEVRAVGAMIDALSPEMANWTPSDLNG